MASPAKARKQPTAAATTPSREAVVANSGDGHTSRCGSSSCGYIHSFGYHLAKKLLGTSHVDETIIRHAYNQLQLQEQEELQQKNNNHSSSSMMIKKKKKNKIYTYRANWRSANVRYPWQLPKDNVRAGSSSSVGNNNGEDDTMEKIISPETLFVDVTFDFIVFPTEVVDEGRTRNCHILKKSDFGGGD